MQIVHAPQCPFGALGALEVKGTAPWSSWQISPPPPLLRRLEAALEWRAKHDAAVAAGAEGDALRARALAEKDEAEKRHFEADLRATRLQVRRRTRGVGL